jgi:hypothetical protein
MMKLLVVMSIDEHSAGIKRLLRERGVIVFSETDIRGYRFAADTGGDDRSNWFAHTDPAVYSHLFFSVVAADRAELAMDAIGEYSASRNLVNPIHAFLVNVEKFI